ncbi:hypothetical protein LZ30DRAFT_708618 [Colletotrichum cereale]|nr:hypothetical protein LZ30DRAFT_708618 [Colletotrichum cereale]
MALSSSDDGQGRLCPPSPDQIKAGSPSSAIPYRRVSVPGGAAMASYLCLPSSQSTDSRSRRLRVKILH